MIIEKSNGNGEIEVFSYMMDGYDDDIKIVQDGVDEINMSKHQAENLVEVLQKWLAGEEVE